MFNKTINKVLIVTGVILLTPVAVFAGFIGVEMNSDFLSLEPAENIQFKLTKDAFLYDNEFFASNTVINCDVQKIIEPKRLKRSASFECKPTTYRRADEDVKSFDIDLKVKFAKILDKKAAAKGIASKVVSTTANFFVPGLGLSVGAVTGAAEAKDHKFKAAMRGIYESTPFSYIEKGSDLDLGEGDIVLVKINKI